jgi:hypothetical protein
VESEACWWLLVWLHLLRWSIALACRDASTYVPRKTLFTRPNALGYTQSHICRMLRLILFPPIHPFQCSSFGQSSSQSGQLPFSTFGTLCHAQRLRPSITMASPEFNLMASTSGSGSFSIGSRPIRNIAEQPMDIEMSPADEDSAMSRCGESWSPGE